MNNFSIGTELLFAMGEGIFLGAAIGVVCQAAIAAASRGLRFVASRQAAPHREAKKLGNWVGDVGSAA